MPPIEEGQLRFDFPKGWRVSKFDDWSFYRNQFGKLASANSMLEMRAFGPLRGMRRNESRRHEGNRYSGDCAELDMLAD